MAYSGLHSFSEGICVREVTIYMRPESASQHPTCMPLQCPICIYWSIQLSRLWGQPPESTSIPNFYCYTAARSLYLIWQTMLSHLGDKYGKDILSFWQALRFYVPIFFVKASSIVINVSQYHIFKNVSLYPCKSSSMLFISPSMHF